MGRKRPQATTESDVLYHARYVQMIDRLVLALGSLQAVRRALGTGKGTLESRIKHVTSIRGEHVLAAEALSRKLGVHQDD